MESQAACENVFQIGSHQIGILNQHTQPKPIAAANISHQTEILLKRLSSSQSKKSVYTENSATRTEEASMLKQFESV